jgi:lantibiotic biosynthesis protein
VLNTRSTGWVPILTSSSGATAAWAGIDAVVQAIVAGDYELPKGRGDADALLFAYLAAARSDESLAVRATDRLNATIAQAPSHWLGLYGGLCGLAWTVEHVSHLLDAAFPTEVDGDVESAGSDDETQDDGDLNAEVDAEVLRRLQQVPVGAWLDHYDLISGLVGYGTYLLERWPAETAKAGVELVIQHLEAIAERTDGGITWHTRPDLLPEWQRQGCPGGYYNLGVAHGMPGVIHFLSEAMAAGVEHKGAGPLLDGAVDWLMAQRRPAGSASWFSGWLAPGHATDSRGAWCYGDIGILSVLFQVARRRRRDDVRRFANDLLDHCLARAPEDYGVVDAPLCHGATGAAHVFNRLYQVEGDPRCRDAALAWFDRALAMRQPTSAVGGFLASTRPDLAGPIVWEASPAFLDGAIGVALALLSAVTATEPSWDRLLLLSGRNLA